MNETWGWTSDQWTAAYTLLTAGLLFVAVVAAIVAYQQVRAVRATQRESSRPYVIVTAESSPIGWRVLDLVVRNIGQRPAYNVRLALDPEPVRTEETPQAPLSEVRMLTEPIPMLAPGQELRTYYDQMEERLNSGRTDLPMSHDYTVEYDSQPEPDEKGNDRYRDHGMVDLNALGGAMQPDVLNIHHVARALRDIKKEMAKASRKPPGTLVFGNTGGRSRAEAEGILGERGPSTEADAEPAPTTEDNAAEPSPLRRLYHRFTGTNG